MALGTDTAREFSKSAGIGAKSRSVALGTRINKKQMDIIISSLIIVSVVLALVFLRLGYVYEYEASFRLIVLYDRTTPAYPAYRDDEWGLLARMGLLGVIFGVVTPVVLCAVAAFLAAGTDRGSVRQVLRRTIIGD
jgi:heme/copper-type cytochrome/quinol oxidase subunit 2